MRPAPDNIRELLVDYTEDNDLKKTLCNFLYKTTGEKFDESSFYRPGGSLHRGLSGNPVFLVRDAKGNLKFVVKVFEKPFGSGDNLIKELAGFQLASTISCKSFSFTSVVAVGKCCINNRTQGLFAITPAIGESLSDLVRKMACFQSGTPQRKQAFRILSRALKRVAVALSELHRVRAQKKKGIHPAVIQRATECLYGIAFQEYSDIDFQYLENYFNSLVGSMEAGEFIRSIVHGDANLGNFIYDTETDSLTIIDLAELSQSADQLGNPIHGSVTDVVNMSEMIGGGLSEGMTPEELVELRGVFNAEYVDIPSGVEREFFVLFRRLGIIFYILDFLKKNKHLPEEMVSPLKHHLSISFDRLKAILVKSRMPA